MKITRILVSKKLLSTFAILFLCSNLFISAFISPVINKAISAPSEVAPTAGTTASWTKEHESRESSSSWRNLAWEFGPYPSYVILLKNGTEVTDANFIPVGEEFAIIMNVQKGIFTGNETLGGAGLNWHIDILNATNPQDMLGWANARMSYINRLVGEKAMYLPPEWKNGTFNVWSDFYNKTEQAVQGPGVKFGVSSPGDSDARLKFTLTATNRWDASSPPQSLPAIGNTTYVPGVNVGDWANYTLLIFTSNKTQPGSSGAGAGSGAGMPSNGTRYHIEIRNVTGSRVEFGITTTDANGTRTTGHWIDVASGQVSDQEAEMMLVASNLKVGDKVYNTTSAGKINQTVVKTFGDAQRLVNYYLPENIAWDRSTGFVVSQNMTIKAGGTGPGPGQGPGPSPSKSFYIFNGTASFVEETAAQWTIHIVGKFNATITPKGPYNVNLEVYNSHHDRIDFGYSAWSGKSSPWRMIAVGKPGLAYAGYSEFWTFGKYDMKNQTVYSVARGSPFIMRVNVTSLSLANVTLALDIDDNIKTYVNVTNWHMETRTETGGWQYNSSSGTYSWNSTVQVQRTEQVYGSYQEERWIWTPHRNNVNITESYWNSTTQQNEIRTRTQEIYGEKLYLIYNHTAKVNNDTSKIFTLKQGYSYWGYAGDGMGNKEIFVLKDVNSSDLAAKFFSLNTTRSRSYKVGDKWVIDFVGSFNKTSFSTRTQYWLNQPTVYRTDGRQIWADWQTVNWSEFQIAVDQLVAITKVFDSSGREVKSGMLMTNVNKPFTVQSTLQGGEKFFSDIDAFGVRMQAGEGRWAPTESYWSNVEIRVIYNKYEGTLSTITYNRTEKSGYVYGPHMAWMEANVTGFHNAYNTTSGRWEWINETYTQWNYENVTGYYWGYWSLNQTEYARNSSSPNIWIDRSNKWIDWNDPAFQVPTSYATLNSANISLVEGLIVANLNITFNTNSPQTRYWWEAFFGNRTYGVDWTKGWGEHTITEWTNSLLYYVNVTSGDVSRKWYVDTPSQPYYVRTVSDIQKHRVYETPYIVIGASLASGTKYYTKTRTTYDFGSGQERVEYLLRDPWDPVTQKEPRYYELLNGTRLTVNQGYKVILRDIKLNTTNVYKFNATGGKVYLPNQTIFNTFMDHSEQDWGMAYYNETRYQWVYPYAYELINGSRIFRDQAFEDQIWNSTTKRYDLTDQVYSANSTSQMVNFAGRAVFLNGTILVKLRDDSSWWQSLLGGTGYYLVMQNGTRIFHQNPWMYDDARRIVTINGKNYSISWPTEYYTGTYNNRTIIAKGGWQGFVRDYYYTTIGGTKYEMPYPGALATSWWDLENLESSGGKLPTGKSITIGSVKYPIYQDGTTFYILNGTTRRTVTKPDKDVGTWYSRINGVEYWDITQGGWALTYGTYNQRTGQIESVAGTLVTTTGYDAASRMWTDWRKYGEDNENNTRYLVNMADGNRLDVYSGRYLSVWPVTIGGKTYYTMDRWDRSDYVGGIYKQYIRQLNGSKVYFDWGTNPPNWGTEIKVELPGTNYTRLIPYVWENETYLDKTYIYNITITNNQGIWYQNRTTQVPNGTRLYIWGTRYGPGIRVNYNWDKTYSWISGLPRDGDFSYFETIQGERIYCNRSRYMISGRYLPDFGWDGGARMYRVDPDWPQWSGTNSTSNTVEGGRFIRLIANGTFIQSFLETTSAGWQYEYPNYYVLLKNGTRRDFTWEGWTYLNGMYVGDRSAVIGDHLYWSDGYLGTYYNVTYHGAIYHLNDESYLSATTQQVPVPVFNNPVNLQRWMNATSDKILKDNNGYFLINASNLARLNLTSVSSWWSTADLSEKVRSELFTGWDVPWELRNTYVRYNVTLGTGASKISYYVLDPSPTTGYWYSGSTGDNSRYPTSFTFNNTTYPINYNDWDRYSVRNYDAIVVNGTKYEFQDQWQWKAVYTVPSLSNAQIQIASENIYKKHTSWGPTYAWMLTNLPVVTIRSVMDIVVGTPKWDMWGVKSFTTVPETGAVDLDGDLTTTNDQFFVRRIQTGSDTMNTTEDRMFVHLTWDPNATVPGDEMRIGAWMGKVHNTWTFTWNETYIWHYASNTSIVNSATMSMIKNTLIDNSTGNPKPGYWEISRMAQNTTWEDLKAQAKKEGWDWFQDNVHEWEWMWFGTRQDYVTSWNSSGVLSGAHIGMQYEFAGLLLYNDTDADNTMAQSETTHFFMPKNVGTVAFKSPGEDYGNTNDTGTVNLNLTDTVNFGVTFNQVNGTLFPYDSAKPRDMWGWWGGNVYGSDYGVPNFNNKPTSSSMNLMSFMVHFNASVTGANSVTNNEAVMKIDERFGQWSIDPNIIDGRTKTLTGNLTTYLKGLEILTGRSLAASWYVTAFTNVGWQVNDASGARVSATENVTQSDTFDMTSAYAKFATVNMGGTFDWKKPTGTNDTVRSFNVTSYTTPLGTFRASYVSDTGKSSAGFDITESMYFLTVGFDNWDGYPVYHDPQTTAYMAKFGSSVIPKSPTSISCQPSKTSITKGDSVTISGAINASVAAQVTIQTSTDNGATWGNLTTVTTGSDGKYSYSWTPTATGTYKIRATWSGDSSYIGATSSEATVTVSESAKTSTSITCSLSSTSITKGSSITVSGAISPAVSGASVTIQTSTDGGATWSSLTTVTSASDGTFSYTWTPTTAGTYNVRTTWSGDTNYNGATSQSVTLTVAESGVSTTISLALSKDTITKGESVTISGTISPAITAEVTIQTSTDNGATWSTLTKVNAGSDGKYSYVWTPATAGTYKIRATYAGDATHTSATSQVGTLTVKEVTQPADNTGLIIVGAVIAIIVVVAGVFFVKRKPSSPTQ